MRPDESGLGGSRVPPFGPASQGLGSLWAVFLYRLPPSAGALPWDSTLLDQLRALPYEGATFLRRIGRRGNILCCKGDDLRPRDLEGLIERVANIPAFARSCADLRMIHTRALRLAAGRFGPRMQQRSHAFTALGATWRLGAAFLSLPWPLVQRPWQFLSRDLLCLDWRGSKTAIIAKRGQAVSGGRLGWERRLLRPFEDVGGAAQEYPLLATARPLTLIRALLAAAEHLAEECAIPGALPA